MVLQATKDLTKPGEWCLDSGASSHMCKDKELFKDLKPPPEDHILIGDGTQLEVLGIGTVQVTFTTKGGRTTKAELRKVLLVPRLKANLISVGQLTKKGVSVNFNG